MKRPGGEVEPCSFPSDFAARSFVRRLAERGSPLVREATHEPEPTRLERRVPHHNVGGDPLTRGATFETERMVFDRGLANRPPTEAPTQTPGEPDGI